MKLYLNDNVTLTVERKYLTKSLGLNLTNTQKVKTAIEMAEYYGYTDAAEFEETNGKDAIVDSILSELVMDFIIENAIISEAK